MMMDNLTSETTLTFPVDPEHSALRSTVFASFFAIWLGTYILINALFPNEGLNLIAGIVGFGLAALLVSQVIEPGLRRRWPSGRHLDITSEHVRVVKKERVEQEINAAEPFNILLWNFTIKQRRNRVPKGWLVMACALEQNENYLPVYALVSPEQAQTLQNQARFVTLVSDKETPKAMRQETLRVTGEQRRLRLAENHRWADGAELAAADFEQFLARLKTQFPEWMSATR
ncbi:MAG TPA: hypothetical protein VHO69_11965 [Phototrophicaceae bacterium]|nr:hypothetical protein [Phototrophicaceae bacterium]